MTQTQNLSTTNALVRLTMGLSMLAYGTSCLVKKPSSNKGRMLVLFGAMKAAEGTVKYCPTKALMNTTSVQNMMGGSGAQSSAGGSRIQNMMSGSGLQNMMGGSGLQNAVPEVGQLMKDFANIGSGMTNNNSSSNSNQSGSLSGNNIANMSGFSNAANLNSNGNGSSTFNPS